MECDVPVADLFFHIKYILDDVPLPWQRHSRVFVKRRGAVNYLFSPKPWPRNYVKKRTTKKKTMEKEIMFWIGINPMVRLIFKKKKDIAMWAQFVCSSWNIVIWLQHRLFGGWRSKTPCSRLGIALPCGCSTNRPGVRAKTTFNHHRNKETNAPNTHKAWFSKVQGQFYIMTKWLHQNKSGYLYQWLTHWYKSI